jgi:uncharacterized protein YdhG (YjbR/CyaY superfamily)
MITSFNTVDEYISKFPAETQFYLNTMRDLILKNAPEAEERISYGMPAYKMRGIPLVYFAGYKNHIGFYATPEGHETFKDALSIYKQGKGSVQFPLKEKLPVDLIAKIVRFKVKHIESQSK